MNGGISMLIAIDHGNSRIKTADTSFVSGYTEFGNEPPMAQDVIHFEDGYFALTETRVGYQFDKTKTEDFYIFTLFAIAKEVMAQGAYQAQMDIELAVGLPPIHYGLLKRNFADYLMRGRRQVSFTYNGKPFLIRITRVFVYPQAYAAIVTRLPDFAGMPNIAVVDIGGFTVDTLLLTHGKLDMEYCLSLNLGVIKLYNKAEQKGIARCGYAVKPGDVDDILRHCCNLNEKPFAFAGSVSPKRRGETLR
jgi:plasmid segregation protein ParM